MVAHFSALPVRWLVVLYIVAAMSVAGCGGGQLPAPPDTAIAVKPPAAPATVELYDPTRDPAADLAAAIATAQAGDMRILVQVGGNWCGWCHRLHQYIDDHQAVARAIDAGFVIMMVNFSDENRNEAFLGQYPDIPGFPHLFVLDSDGTLLHSQGTAELEEGSSYSEPKILAFLSQWRK